MNAGACVIENLAVTEAITTEVNNRTSNDFILSVTNRQITGIIAYPRASPS